MDEKQVEIRQKKVIITLKGHIAVPIDSDNIVMTMAFIAEIPASAIKGPYDDMPSYARIVGFIDGRPFKKSRMVTLDHNSIIGYIDFEEA